ADQFVDGLVATERGLDGVLRGDVGAHTHIGHQRQTFDVVVGQMFRPGDAQPSGAVAAHAVGLGQPGEGQAQDVVTGVGSGVVVHGLLEEDLLVDLIGEDHQIVAAGDVHQGFDHLFAVDGAGGVVRVDDHQGVGIGGDLGLDVLQVRHPRVGFVAQVVHGSASGEGDGTGPQRVV